MTPHTYVEFNWAYKCKDLLLTIIFALNLGHLLLLLFSLFVFGPDFEIIVICVRFNLAIILLRKRVPTQGRIQDFRKLDLYV